MTNQYVPNVQDLLPGELARSSDINNRYGYVIAGFDKLPAPLTTGQGFSDPVPVGTPTSDEHAVTKIFAETTMVTAAEVAALAYITPTLNTHLSDTTALQQQAATSASDAAASATAAQSSANAASASQAAAAGSASQAESNYQFLRDRFLGPKTAAPTTDDDGDPLQQGAVYYNTVQNRTYVYHGTAWQQMATPLTAVAHRVNTTALNGQTTFNATYYPGEVDVFLNGIKLQNGVDFTATDGVTVTLSVGANAGDEVQVLGFQSVELADIMTEAETISFIEQNLNSLVADSEAIATLIDDAVGESAILDLGI